MYRFRFQLFYSTAAAAATSRNNLLAEMLVNSLGFSTEKAISTSAKVTFLKPGNNKPQLVINFFQQIGLDKTHIKTLVCATPSLLFSDVDKTLKPKIKVLQELGLSGSDIAKVLSKTGIFLLSSLENTIRRNISYLRQLLGSDDSLAKAIRKDSKILWYNAPKVMSPNVAFLRNLGFSGKDIEKLILRDPRILLLKETKWLENAVHRVERNLHIPRDSNMFIYGFMVTASLGESCLEMKLRTFRRFGWSDLEILTLVQKLPLCLTSSEARLGKGLNFFMKELAGYLASHPALLTFSLEKRVLPRHEILKLLDQKKLAKSSLNLYTALMVPESKFLNSYVLPYTDETPELYELYMNSRR
ncbi:transcription termination factor MTERF15, mitochondrial-like [Nicotiana tomentosiformis]|uniref:Uncharacterized protein n=1 Tax=Nicotiana tabacum TaxID=4097 RepID=A0A1S3Z3D5_TOBAC|nr:transcription termination factor MTERF15, mitochondrial-like [Nicotiana tomentosiformis]XP_016458941.1 PREDICTED: uncharacterized protein LOC107782571 [Nicotiana tabacum]